MSDDDKQYKTDFASLRELFTEYVTLDREYEKNRYELKIPWYHITQIEGRYAPDKIEKTRNKGEVCSDLWWIANGEVKKCKTYETPTEIETEIQAAKDRMFAAMKKQRMPLIF
tara:strand:+ start:150 stop:488 length:339 start_codon:yes stop_codon:yes gene_type:complete